MDVAHKTVSKKVKTDEVEDHEEASKDEYDVDTNASENGVRKERFADLQSAIETSEDGDVKFENSHSAITLPSKFGSVLHALNTNSLAITKMTQQPCSKFTDNYELKEELGK